METVIACISQWFLTRAASCGPASQPVRVSRTRTERVEVDADLTVSREEREEDA
jgi:hypothetical protein